MRIVLGVTLLIAMSVSAGAQTPAGACDPKGRKAKLNFTFKDVNNRKVSLSDFKGKVILLDFWATWCVPCKAEIPGFIDLQKKYGARGLQIIGISVDDPARTAKKYADDMKMNYPVLLAEGTGGHPEGLRSDPEHSGQHRDRPRRGAFARNTSGSRRWTCSRRRSLRCSDELVRRSAGLQACNRGPQCYITGMATKTDKTDAEWQAALTPMQYQVSAQALAPSLAGSSPLNKEKREGTFTCAGCGQPLFSSDTKYESGSGWPSFYAPLEDERRDDDRSELRDGAY